MATSKEYKEFILEQLDLLDNITCKAMMGEFLLYNNNILFGGIYDNRLLVKIVDTNKKYNMQEQTIIQDFSNKFNCELSILENGEHYFHTEEQLDYYKNWLDKVL